MEQPQPPHDEIEDLRLRVRIMHRFSLFMLAGAVLCLYYWHSAPTAQRSKVLLFLAGIFALSTLLKVFLAARWQARLRQLERR